MGGVAAGERLRRAVDLHRSRAHTLRALAEMLVPYVAREIPYDRELGQRFLGVPGLVERVERLAQRYAAVEPWGVEALETALRDLAGELGVKAGDLIHPLRMALSGAKAGPPVFDLVAVMGREATARHLARFTAWLRAEKAAAGDAE